MNRAMLFQFLSGALMLAYWAIGFFFMCFWRRTRDRLFAVFAWAFWVLAIERMMLLLLNPQDEFRPYVYLVRLAAFLLIIGAILDKNRSTPGERE